MSRSRPDNREALKFQCLHCKNDRYYNGYRDNITGKLYCSGLIKHIKSKKSSDASLLCLAYYLDLSTNMNDINLSSSIVGNGSLSDSDSSMLAVEFGGFQEAVLPKSNSLKSNQKFRKNPFKNAKCSFQPPKINHSKLDKATYPSKKLLPAISYNAILEFAKTMARLKPVDQKVLKRHRQESENLGFTLVSYEDLDDSSEGQEEDSDSQGLEEGQDGEDSGSEGSNEDVMIVPMANPPKPTDLMHRLRQEEKDRRDPSKSLPTMMVMHQELLRIQEKHKMSFAAFDDVIKWAQQAELLQEGIFKERFPSRQTMLQEYRRLLGLGPDAYQFTETVVREWLPDKKPCVIR